MSVDLDTLRVEYSIPEHDYFISDPRFKAPGSGWFLPGATVTYTRDQYPIAALEDFNSWNDGQGNWLPFEYAVFDTTGTNGIVYSRFMPLMDNGFDGSPGRLDYARMNIGRTSSSPIVNFNIELWSDTALLETTSDYDADPNPLATDMNSIANVVGWNRVVPGSLSSLPAGATRWRIKLTGVGIYAVRNLEQFWGEIESAYWGSASTPPEVARRTWYDVTPYLAQASIRRGCRENPPVDQLEIGTATLQFGRAMPNATIATVRPGYRVRVRGRANTSVDFTTVYEGRIVGVSDIKDAGKEKGYVEWRAEDRVADLARRRTPFVRAGNTMSIAQDIESIVNPTPKLVNTIGPSVHVRSAGTTTPLLYNETITWDDDAVMLDHLLTFRNTELGLLWCDRNNQMNYVASQWGTTVPNVPNRPTHVFVTQNVKTGERSPAIEGFDREQTNNYAVNVIEEKRLSYNAGQTDPYTELTIIHYNDREVYSRGLKYGSVTYFDTQRSLVLYNAYMSQFAADNTGGVSGDEGYVHPTIDTLVYDASKDTAFASNIDVYDNVNFWIGQSSTNPSTMNNGAGNHLYYRAIGLEHEIGVKNGKGSWVVKMTLRPKERLNKTDSKFAANREERP